MINAIVTTHDGYGLAATLNAIAQGSKLPDRIVVTCDGIDKNVDQTVACFRKAFRGQLIYVRREHKGRARRSQTRNNGVRALSGLGPDDVLFFLDGHILLGPNHFRLLDRMLRYDVILSCFRRGDRILSEQIASQGVLDESKRPRASRSPELFVRSMKIAVQKMLRATDRTWGTAYAKVWWPSLCSANFAVKYDMYNRVNGFDEREMFDDWTPEDDDLGRRLYAAGATICNATVRLGGFHLWHTSNREERIPKLLAELPKYFTGPVEAEYGLRNPRDQADAELKIDRLSP